MKNRKQNFIRGVLKKLIRAMLKLIGPRMTMWALYCIFAGIESETEEQSLQVQSKAWHKVCRCLSEATNICEEMEVTEGWGLRSHPIIVDEGGQVRNCGNGVTIVTGHTTCREWVKTTDKFPWLGA